MSSRRSEVAPSEIPRSTSRPLEVAEVQSSPVLSSGVQPVTRTRSGRTVKPPERYVPVEVCDDDYEDEDYDDTDLSDVSSEMSVDSEEISSESDADENGNLDGFVTEDKTDESDVDNDVSASESDE